jgi:hypothetical protein
MISFLIERGSRIIKGVQNLGHPAVADNKPQYRQKVHDLYLSV